MIASSKCVLITGINGFTGSYLKDLLVSRGYQVHGTGRGENYEGDSFYHPLDLLDSEGIKRLIQRIKPDYIIHLAAIAFVGHGKVSELYEANLIGTQCLLQAILESGVEPKKVILSSSANVYGNADIELIHEAVSPKPTNDYAVSKLAMEYMAQLRMGELPIIIARPFNYTGAGQSANFLIPKIISHFANHKRVIELGNIDVYRDFSDVRSVAQAYAGLMESSSDSIIVNICSGNSISLRDIVSMSEKVAGYSIDVKVNADFVRPNEIRRLTGDCSLLKEIVPDFQSIDIQNTVKWMLEYI